MEQTTQCDTPKGEIIYEDDRIQQIYYPDKDLIIQIDKTVRSIPVIIKRKINPAWLAAGKHPHGVLAVNERSYDRITVGPPPSNDY